MKKWLPLIIVAIAAGWVLYSLKPAPPTAFDTADFARLPALLNGRIQPLDSVAANTLLQIRNKRSVALDDGKELSAIDWFLEVTMKPEVADTRKIFRIDNPDMLGLLKLSDKEKHFSYNQLQAGYDEIRRQAARIDDLKIETQAQTPFEKQVMKLANALYLYRGLEVCLRPPGSDNFARDLEVSLEDVAALRSEKSTGHDVDMNQPEVADLAQYVSGWDAMARDGYALVVPPDNPEQSRDDWHNVGTSLMDNFKQGRIAPAVTYYAAMVTAYRDNNAAQFNQALGDYRHWLGDKFAPEVKKGNSEYFFNHFEPFMKAMVIYLVAFLLACFFWFNWSPWLRTSAFYLILFAWCIHTFGLVYRMVLEGRPPVTNLYSSAIFIGWGAAILGMVLERIYKDGIGCVISAVAGFVTLVIAHNLALGGDTMEMLRAVLDTNFWLATHVTVVTLGYASTFVAGFLAIIYILRGVFTRSLDEATAKALTRMVYGIVCFATLFSFVGTILGGIWADQSWGRFWGWDPKENGALMIVIWNATILHARWGGMVRERGLMNMAIFGNIITSFSWFGVNMLGIGLHSYGFTDAAFMWLLIFVGSQVMLIALGLLPRTMWLSFRERAVSSHPAKPGTKSLPATT